MTYFKFHPNEREISEYLQGNFEKVLVDLHETNKRLFLAVCIGYFTGARISELSSLSWDDINLKANTIHFRRRAWNLKGTKGTKRGRMPKQRILPLVGALKKVIIMSWQSSVWLFPNYETGRHITKETLSRELKQWCEKREYSFTFHDLRHLFASCRAINTNPMLISKMLGHSDIKSTLIYTHFDLEDNDNGKENNKKWTSKKHKRSCYQKE